MSLRDAIESNDLYLMKQLISTGADLNAIDWNGLTPLTYAAYRNRVDFVRILLEAKADINKADSDSYTPLHYAVSDGYTECFKVMMMKL